METNKNREKDDSKVFVKEGSTAIPSLPVTSPARPVQSGFPIASGVATGSLAYLAAPSILGFVRDGVQDEITGVAVAAATYFASSIVAPNLCATKKDQKRIEKWNIAKGVSAGVLAGVPIAFKIAADIIATGGILSTMGALWGLGVWAYNKFNKFKYCAHCDRKDSCNHVVCRRCFKLHFPMETPLQCDKSISLTWYALASQLHYDGLNYFESLNLIREHFDEWHLLKNGKGDVDPIECTAFVEWRNMHKDVISSYRQTITEEKGADWEDIKDLEKTENLMLERLREK